ncbi:UvrD-helicase domain-containing protein [Microbulbifer sp. SA54]|uniref:UvrD-helicase domain-containing protein n=1 Tax=Microbulbifer sp. SA54 TaxID=3401577 RepID=UPI003AADF9C8
MKDRPYTQLSFEQLQDLFEKNTSDVEILESILDELRHRTRNKRVPSLLSCVSAKLDKLKHEQPEPKTSEPSLTGQGSDKGVFPAEADAFVTPANWDSEQRTVIELDEDAYRIVEAGPGSGKTAVACARVAHLVEQGDLEASKIFLISFTRTAVKELRDRIEALTEDKSRVKGLQILTLDSFTWQVLKGLNEGDPAILMRSYEGNIKRFIELLDDADEGLLDYLQEFEHVILDEGQDLVGDRAELAMQIIRNLDPACGVTVFADSAQAIYGFTNDSEQRDTHHSRTVVERLMAESRSQFQRLRLDNIHRTTDPNLKRLFTQGRERLLDRVESNKSGWKEMKQLIASCAHGKVGPATKQDIAEKSDHLVLYRTRAEVLMDSAFLWKDGINHKIRMSGMPERVHPWIGHLFAQYGDDLIEQQQFSELCEAHGVEAPSLNSETVENAWTLLRKMAGTRDRKVKVSRLRELVGRDRPPIELLVDESELPGATLGTIHASKGREANQVHLMLPPDSSIDDNPESDYVKSPAEIAEEERVLFVGATRARKRLMVGQGNKLYSSRYDGRRTYRKPRKDKNARMIEVGLGGDIDPLSLADERLEIDHAELQQWLWENSKTPVELEIFYEHTLKANIIRVAETGRIIGLMSRTFSYDLWGIGRIVSEKNGAKSLRPSSKIRHIRMTGATTLVIPEAHREQLLPPWRHSGFLLAPVITGFPKVFFN